MPQSLILTPSSDEFHAQYEQNNSVFVAKSQKLLQKNCCYVMVIRTQCCTTIITCLNLFCNMKSEDQCNQYVSCLRYKHIETNIIIIYSFFTYKIQNLKILDDIVFCTGWLLEPHFMMIVIWANLWGHSKMFTWLAWQLMKRNKLIDKKNRIWVTR